jgi:hypothetical protein
VRQTRVGGTDTEAAVVILADEGTTQGAGVYLEGNIIYEAESLVQNQTTALVTYTNNIITRLDGTAWSGPGGNNVNSDPLFKYVPQVTETSNFTSWAAAQVMREWFSLRADSPAIGTGPNGRDKGGVVPLGVSISGEPSNPAPSTTATLAVGVNRTGNGIPTAGWPNGSGFTHYQWRLDGGAWSTETAMSNPISLSGLAAGSHRVEVVGRNDAGLYQNDPVLGSDARVTVSRSWTVNPGASTLVLNEVLASNDKAVNHFGTAPDMIELRNLGATALDLAGVRLTDDPLNPGKFTCPLGTAIGANSFLVVYANNSDGTQGLHLGFSLPKEGGSLYLFDAPGRGGALLDSVSFGPQVTDLSIGRLGSGGWALNQPTLGGANLAAALGSSQTLALNEWLALGQTFDQDFIEVYNPDGLPVSLGGLFLTDEPRGWPNRHEIAPLSFLSGRSYGVFIADGHPAQGPTHLNFTLNPDQGMIGLYQADLALIDSVVYGAQFPDRSQGRSPNGGTAIVSFSQPTPGAPNPYSVAAPPAQVVGLLPVNAQWSYEQSGADLGTAWKETNYIDAAWALGRGVLGYDNANNSFVAGLTNTVLALSNGPTAIITYYFRTHFQFTTAVMPTSVIFTNLMDDGAIVYLNGTELYRINMPAGTVTSATYAAANAETTAFAETSLAGTSVPLRPGDNLLAVELHQYSGIPSDLNMGLGVGMTIVSNPPAAGSVVINEVLANNASSTNADGSTPDWVELYNLAGTETDLSGLTLSDDSLQPQRWAFPAGTRLAPGAFLRVFCDGGQTNSATNTGFGLKASGGVVYLFDKPENGGSLIDSIAFGLQAADFSIGRFPDGSGAWQLGLPTAGSANLAVSALGDPAALKVNEWMADPGPGKEDWFELYNPNAQPVAVGGLYLTDDLNNRTKHRIAPLSFIGAGTNAWQKFVADGNTGAGADHVSFALKAGGEAVAVSSTNGTLLDGYAFGPQEEGVSAGRFPDGSANVVASPGTASPGDSNYRWLTNVAINEALTHSDLPLEDAIELRNLTGQDIDLSGWWLSDDKGRLQKFQIPSPTILPANGYAVFYENVFSNRVLAVTPFSLSSKGDEIVLSAAAGNALTGWRTIVSFGAAESGVSFGRHLTSDGREEFVAMRTRTFGMDTPDTVQDYRLGTGLPNAYPKVGPVVISEIMYHPPDLVTNDNVRDEYIELQNISSAPVPLYDPAYPTNVWHLRNAVDFDFAPRTVLGPNGTLVVVSFDPVLDPVSLAAFQAEYGLGANIAIFGPYRGKLANDNESIHLEKPDAPTTTDVPYVLVERVKYYDAAPWPTGPDGLGYALQRVSLTGFGNDPTNWMAAAPTPGASVDLQQDTDHDGIPDWWMMLYFDHPTGQLDDSSYASQDADADGMSNLAEYQAGTDPTDPASALKAEVASPADTLGANVVIHFDGVAPKAYRIEYAEGLPPSWQTLIDLSRLSASGPVWVTNAVPAGTTQRFYRITIPTP